MSKPKLLGMKELAVELGNLSANLRIPNHIVAAAAVRFITDDWMFYPRKVHANLMRAASLQFDVNEREPVESFTRAINRAR